jgi:excisionase family DNA binding protein
MNAEIPEILTLTLPEEKPPIVDATQIFEVGGINLQARLTLINNVLPASAVQQEQDPPLAVVKLEGSEYLTAKEAAAYIKVHVETLREWFRLGVFPHVPLPGAGKDYRFSKTLIDEWARNRALGKPK